MRMRLGEHTLHTWDVAVALDPSAQVSPDAIDLLVDGLGDLVAPGGEAAGRSLCGSDSNHVTRPGTRPLGR